jgi:hypothetical protein
MKTLFVPRKRLKLLSFASAMLFGAVASHAIPVTNPDDPRDWQGATVGTFAKLYFGSDTLANRQLVVDQKLLDDGLFDFTGSSAATMIANSGGASGISLDTLGTGTFGYNILPGGQQATAGGSIDQMWVQTSGVIGADIWDFGALASKAAIFNTIDHVPLPLEAIESTVYLSNDKINWTQAVTERVWLEGFEANLGIKWDGFAYAVGTGTDAKFRYASIIWGGPGALQADGDNEINGVLGLNKDFTPVVSAVPIPAALPMLASGLALFGFLARKRKGRQAIPR